MIKRVISSWVKTLTRRFFGDRYRFRYVEESPEHLKPKTVYIVKDGKEPDSLLFECPCGCGNRIELNLLSDCSPRWLFVIERNKISISPSVWAIRGCRSHFWIRDGKVDWGRRRH